MKVKILTSFRSSDGNYKIDDTPDLPEHIANRFITIGYAEKLETKKKKTASKKRR